MKANKLLTLLAVATLPFLAACMSPTEKIARGLSAGTLTRAEARKALTDGAEISARFLEEAARKGKIDLVNLFIEKGVNPWVMKDATGMFSLFDYATQESNYELLKLCLNVKERTPELAEKKSTEFVESVITSLASNKDFGAELQSCNEIWDAELALATKPKMEAKQKRIAEKAREDAKKVLPLLEKQVIRERYRGEIRPSEQKLSEAEHSRGRALLDAFGEEHMPTLAKRCKVARTVYLESEANFEELIKALKAENVDLKTNEVFQAAENRWLDLAADYWWLRYKLTDFYSQFKIGAITSDELAERDAEFAEK